MSFVGLRVRDGGSGRYCPEERFFNCTSPVRLEVIQWSLRSMEAQLEVTQREG